MKRSLRVTLLTILLSLTLVTVIGVGLSGYLNLRTVARELSTDVLEQTSGRIDERVTELVQTAQQQTSIMLHLFESRALDPSDFPRLAYYWYEVLHAVPQISGLYFIRDDGIALFVMRSPQTKRITIRQVQQAAGGQGWELAVSSLRDYRRRYALALNTTALAGSSAGQGPLLAASSLFLPARSDPETQTYSITYDARDFPSYSTAREDGKSAWTDAYHFFSEEGKLSYPGLSYATPIARPDGSPVGVLGISFNVYQLCDFLDRVDVSKGGYAFLVELQRDGDRKLIAHPDRRVVLNEATNPGELTHSELIEVEDVRDRRVAVFMKDVPTKPDLVQLTNLTPVRFQEDGVTWIGGFRGVGLGESAPPWLICIVLPEDDILGEAKRHAWISLGVALAVLLVAVVLSLFTASQVARPLEALARDAEAIGRLEIDPQPVGHSFILEVDRLACATEDMKTSLRSFRKYVPADLVAMLLRSGQEAELGGERRRLTIYFSDIAGFTSISEEMEPEKLVEHLGEYLQILSEQVLASGGTVDKYIGDAIMAFWGAPQEMAGHALAACTAAVRNQQVLACLREKWRAEGKPLFFSRIGINTGDVVVGNIGSARRLNYTVIGDAVNLASRLEGLNKFYGTAVVISETTYEEARDGIVARPLDWVGVKGKAHGVLVYELLGLKGETEPALVELATLFGSALQAYRRQAWDEAIRGFERVLGLRPDDVPAKEMLERCRHYRESPPGADWDGVHHMESK